MGNLSFYYNWIAFFVDFSETILEEEFERITIQMSVQIFLAKPKLAAGWQPTTTCDIMAPFKSRILGFDWNQL